MNYYGPTAYQYTHYLLIDGLIKTWTGYFQICGGSILIDNDKQCCCKVFHLGSLSK